MNQTFTIIVAELLCRTDSLLKTTLTYGVMMCDSVARRDLEFRNSRSWNWLHMLLLI